MSKTSILSIRKEVGAFGVSLSLIKVDGKINDKFSVGVEAGQLGFEFLSDKAKTTNAKFALNQGGILSVRNTL